MSSRNVIRKSRDVANGLSRVRLYLAEPLEGRCLLSTVIWTGNAHDGHWTSAANWNTNSAPQFGNDVVIQGAASTTVTIGLPSNLAINSLTSSSPLKVTTGTLLVSSGSSLSAALTVTDGYVDFSADSSVSGLVLSGDGGLAGTGTLTVNGPFTWTSGNVDEGTIFAAGGTDFHGGSYDYLNNATFINPSGQVATIGASGNKFLSIGGQSAFVNAGSLVASAGTIGNFSTDFGTTFQNTGTFTVTAVMGTTVLVNTAVLFENTGTVGVQSGTLALNASDAGATGGTFSASTGATLAFGGNFAFAPSSVINGAGTIKFAGGVDIVSGTFNVQGATICSAGNISFPVTVSSFGPTGLTVASQSAYYGPVTHVDLGGQDISLPGLNFAGGVLAGSGTLTIGGLFAWSGGTLTVAKTMANGGIALTYGGISGPTLSGGTLVNPVGQTATLV